MPAMKANPPLVGVGAAWARRASFARSIGPLRVRSHDRAAETAAARTSPSQTPGPAAINSAQAGAEALDASAGVFQDLGRGGVGDAEEGRQAERRAMHHRHRLGR